MSANDVESNCWAEDPPISDDEVCSSVGYKRPPRHSAFKTGQSGNPSGRPKGRRNLPALLKGVLSAPVTVRSGEKSRRMSKAEAMLRVYVDKARRGDERALGMFIEILDLAGQFDELSDDERNMYGVVQVPEKLSEDEWELIYGPDFEEDRQKYLAMPDIPDPNYVPSKAELTYDTFVTQINAGDAVRLKGDIEGALVTYCKAVDLVRTLCLAEPNDMRWRHGMAYGLQRTGNALEMQGNTTAAASAFREALDLLYQVGIVNPNDVRVMTDTARFLCMLANVGDDPQARLREARDIIKQLREQRRLTRIQEAGVGDIEQELERLGPKESLAASPRRRITRPVVAWPLSDSSRADATNPLNDKTGQDSLCDNGVISETAKSLAQWEKGGNGANLKTDKPVGAPDKRRTPIHRKVI